jgi:hypothetical protein
LTVKVKNPQPHVASKQREAGSAMPADLSRRSPAKQDEDGLTDHHPIILTKSVNFFPV